MNTISLRRLLIILLCLGIITAPVRSHATLPKHKELSQQIGEGVINVGLAAGLMAMLVMSAPENLRESFLKQIAPNALLGNLVRTYCSWFVATLAHECGHAVATKLLLDESCIIHIGSNDLKADPLVALGPIHIDSLNPTKGLTENPTTLINATIEFIKRFGDKNLTAKDMEAFSKTQEFLDFKKSLYPDRLKRALILLAGSTSGIIAHHLMEACINKEHHRFFDSITMYHLVNILIPGTLASDATLLCTDCLNIPQSTLDHLGSLATYSAFAGELYCAITDPANPKDTPLHSAVIIGLINYLLRGFFHFHA